MTIPWNFGVPTFSSPYVTSVVLAGKATLGKISASGWCDFCRNPAWNSSQINWTKMKSGQSLVSAELIPYRSFTLLVVTLATMNLVIIEFGLGIKSSHFCTTRNATQRLAASTLGLRYIWIRSQILKRWLFNFIQSKLKLLKLTNDLQNWWLWVQFKLAAFQSHVHLFVIYAFFVWSTPCDENRTK